MTYSISMARASVLAASLFTALSVLSGCNQSCEEGGHTYEDGESWTCSDGCNACGCDNGSINSTAKACSDPDAGS